MVKMTWSPLHFSSLFKWYDPLTQAMLSFPVVSDKEQHGFLNYYKNQGNVF